MIQWTLYILLQYMYNICHYIHTCTHAFLVSHRHRRYIRRGKCSYRYVYCYIFIYMIIYISLALPVSPEIWTPKSITWHKTHQKMGGVGCSSGRISISPWFFSGDPSFHESRFKTLPALRRRGKSQPMRRSNRAGLDATENRFSGWNGSWSHLGHVEETPTENEYIIWNLIFFSYNVCSKMPSLLKKTPVRVHDFTRNRPPQKIGRPSLQATPL